MINHTKRLAIIGATGSIGTQTLDIVAAHPERYSVAVMTAANRVDELIALARKHHPALAIIANASHYRKLKEALEPLGIETAAGADAIADAMERDDFDTVVTATVGYSGLVPTIRAIGAGKDIALANKETLVVAGYLINSLLKKSKSKMFAIDSEHSAIAQCLAGENIDSVKRLIITASGGPFRTWDIADLEHATVKDALNHPNWSMGSKITVDSATMMNKAFEIIEAHHLFGIAPDKITAVVHPQSIVHSMVEFVDGAIKAQLGVPDMRLPIAYALGENSRLSGVSPSLTLEAMSQLTFEAPDTNKFPCLTLAHTALSRGGNTACVINAANEVAVASFLAGQIKFLDIYHTIEHTLSRADFIAAPTFDDFVLTNAAARAIAQEYIAKH